MSQTASSILPPCSSNGLSESQDSEVILNSFLSNYQVQCIPHPEFLLNLSNHLPLLSPPSLIIMSSITKPDWSLDLQAYYSLIHLPHCSCQLSFQYAILICHFFNFTVHEITANSLIWFLTLS